MFFKCYFLQVSILTEILFLISNYVLRISLISQKIFKLSHSFQIFEFVKATILKCLNDEDKCSKSLWARECYPQTIKTEQLVLEAVEHRCGFKFFFLGISSWIAQNYLNFFALYIYKDVFVCM